MFLDAKIVIFTKIKKFLYNSFVLGAISAYTLKN